MRGETENYMLYSFLRNSKKIVTWNEVCKQLTLSMNSACFVVSPGLQFFEITGYSANFYSTPVSTLLNKYSSDAVFEQTIFKEQQQGRNIIAVIEGL